MSAQIDSPDLVAIADRIRSLLAELKNDQIGAVYGRLPKIPRTAILTGDTYQVRNNLSAAGWQYDGTAKAWSKMGAWGSCAEVLQEVYAIDSVSSFLKFSILLQ